MSVKSSISLTKQQDAFARALVESGQYPSLSAVVQQGLELLRQKTEAETIEARALQQLLRQRAGQEAASQADMARALEQMMARKQQARDVARDLEG